MNEKQNYQEFEKLFAALPSGYTNKNIEALDKQLIKEKVDISFLRNYLPEHQEYYKTYFEVSLSSINNIVEKLAFVEEHFYLFHEWWHADLFSKILCSKLPFDLAFAKAKEYINAGNPIVRRFGYILFIPRLTRDHGKTELLLSLLRNDEEECVISSEASLIAFLAMASPQETYQYLVESKLDRKIIGEAVKKIKASRQISNEVKKKYEQL